MQTLIDKFNTLKLAGMKAAWQEQCEQPARYDGLGMPERLELLLERETRLRDERGLQRRLKEAKFRLDAAPERIDYQHPRGLQRSQMSTLLTGEWWRRGQNLLLQAPTGCGKTFLACALGQTACRLGLKVRYFRCRDLFNLLTIARADGRLTRIMGQLNKTGLLILDDWGLEPLTAGQRNDLLALLDDRHGRTSTVVASQLPVKHWYEFIGEPTLADAILDRLVHNAHRIELSGESMRKKLASDGTIGSNPG